MPSESLQFPSKPFRPRWMLLEYHPEDMQPNRRDPRCLNLSAISIEGSPEGPGERKARPTRAGPGSPA